MFVLPPLFIEGECGKGIDLWVYIVYAVQAVVTACYEVWAVLRIEKRIKKKSILSVAENL